MDGWLAFVQGLLQGVEHNVGLHAAADPSTHDAPGYTSTTKATYSQPCQVET
jgi:hypothetical protein